MSTNNDYIPTIYDVARATVDRVIYNGGVAKATIERVNQVIDYRRKYTSTEG